MGDYRRKCLSTKVSSLLMTIANINNGHSLSRDTRQASDNFEILHNTKEKKETSLAYSFLVIPMHTLANIKCKLETSKKT